MPDAPSRRKRGAVLGVAAVLGCRTLSRRLVPLLVEVDVSSLLAAPTVARDCARRRPAVEEDDDSVDGEVELLDGRGEGGARRRCETAAASSRRTRPGGKASRALGDCARPMEREEDDDIAAAVPMDKGRA